MILKKLTEKQKRDLKEAGSHEELSGLLKESGMMLTDDQLSDVAGGCFKPYPNSNLGLPTDGMCPICSSATMEEIRANNDRCPSCRQRIEPENESDDLVPSAHRIL
ncbi:MAG: hypothetical protein J5829_09345 [Lachnospiraceae bacterium]|nr:hypothetical protein [Lachnospiraceae bacterium]